MSSIFAVSAFLLSIALLQATVAAGLRLDTSTIAPVVTQGRESGTCPSREITQTAIERIQNDIKGRIPVINRDCGEGVWYRVAYLDMKDATQSCPSAWREYNTSQFRACGRPVSSVASRPSQIFHISHQYSKVCGRVIGIQFASPDAFYDGRRSHNDINESYMDGVSITRGSPRHHIWSYVGSVGEVSNNVCPCTYSSATQPPSFVGSNYYCESGNPNQYWLGQAYPNDKLWDGEQCSHEGTCCTGTNTPPWFSVNLGSPTSDDI